MEEITKAQPEQRNWRDFRGSQQIRWVKNLEQF